MKAKCIKCGRGFEKRGNTKTCSVECSPTPYRPRKPSVGTCIICGKTFQKPTNGAITCGEECARENHCRYMREYGQRPDRQEKERDRGERRHREKMELRGPMIATCAVCGSEYHKTSRSLTCSMECREVYRAGEWARRFNGHAAGLVKKRGQPRSEIGLFSHGIDRESFGHWLSGFADGEGCFTLRYAPDYDSGKVHFMAGFVVSLRDDDTDALRLIQSYLGCGTLTLASNARSKIPNAKPICRYAVHRVSELVGIVIPHFERFPLMAKKRRDFEVWSEAVKLMASVQSRPLQYRPSPKANRHAGTYPKWQPDERERFRSLSDRLAELRRYMPRAD